MVLGKNIIVMRFLITINDVDLVTEESKGIHKNRISGYHNTLLSPRLPLKSENHNTISFYYDIPRSSRYSGFQKYSGPLNFSTLRHVTTTNININLNSNAFFKIYLLFF